MIEEEAEKYAEESLKGFREYIYLDQAERKIEEAVLFGYRKATEWHDLEKNPDDLPKKGKLVICYLAEDVFDVGIFKTEIELQCGKARIRKWAYFDLPEELK